MASFEKFVGHFTSPTSANSSYAITGVGFTPKVVIFYPTARTATGTDSTSDVTFGMGAMTADDQFVALMTDTDAAATMDVQGYRVSTACIRVYSPAGTLTKQASYVSMDADGFTLNYSLANASAYIVHYIALGGTHLDVAVRQSAMVVRDTDGTPFVYESSSLGFAPKGYLLSSYEGGAGYSDIMFGGSSGSVAESFTVSAFNEDGVSRSDTGRGQSSSHVWQLQGVGPSTAGQAEHSALGVDSFSINKTEQIGAASSELSCIAFGGSIDCFMGNTTLATSGATQAVTVETGFQPDAIMFFGTDQTADGAANDLYMSVGLSDGTNHRGYLFAKNDNSADSDPVTNVSHTHCILSDIDKATGAADDADIDSFGVNGFTIGHNVNPATAWRIGYFAIKDVPTPSFVSNSARRRMHPLLAM